MKTEYRIVTDKYAGFAVQQWNWWFPFWVEPRTNTNSSILEAEVWLQNYLNKINKPFKVVKYL